MYRSYTLLKMVRFWPILYNRPQSRTIIFPHIPDITTTQTLFGGAVEGKVLITAQYYLNQRRTYADVTSFNSNDTRICRYDNGVHLLPVIVVGQRRQHTIHVQFSRYVINSDCEFHRTYRRHAQSTEGVGRNTVRMLRSRTVKTLGPYVQFTKLKR